MIAFDTETTGTDLRHQARPFFISTCDGEGNPRYWEWDVNPLTRQPIIPKGDVEEIGEFLFANGPHGPIGDCEADPDGSGLIIHNTKFDFAAMESIGFWKLWDVREAWASVRDTLLAGHLCASGIPHNLTDMVTHYLGENIEPLEKDLEEAVKEARELAKKEYPDWKIAVEGLEGFPSMKGKVWGNDYWLPRAYAKAKKLPSGHSWWTVLRDYSMMDTIVLPPLWRRLWAEIKDRKLDKVWHDRRNILPVVYDMESRGVNTLPKKMEELTTQYTADSNKAEIKCVGIAKARNYDLVLPKGAVNNSIRGFCFDVLQLEHVYNPKAKSNAPTLNEDAINHYKATLPTGDARDFLETLLFKRKLDTSISYMSAYFRYAVKGKNWTLHPNLNPTGTSTLRHSSDNPNEQNISKEEDEFGFTLRHCFGPAPGREWWAMDYQNIELRIPAYESGEKDLIDLFERADEPPFFGSEHILNFSVVYPDIWEEVVAKVGIDKAAKFIKSDPKMKSTWYQWCKNGDFAVGYQAGDATADRAFHRPGSRARLKARFAKKEALNAKYVAMANRLGYVTTLPDRTVDPNQGYPVMCSRSEWGNISPTIPLNYHVQSTAMQATNKAMVRCDNQFREWKSGSGFNAWIAMQVHDEIVFDLPARGKRNLPKVKKLKYLMEESGRDVGIPLTVSVSYCPESWGKEVKL